MSEMSAKDMRARRVRVSSSHPYVVTGSACSRHSRILVRRPSRDAGDERLLAITSRSYRACDLEAEHVGQSNVEKDQLRIERLDVLECLLTRSCDANLMAQAAQHDRDELCEILVIVNDENA
jgi:hypothetical protein